MSWIRDRWIRFLLAGLPAAAAHSGHSSACAAGLRAGSVPALQFSVSAVRPSDRPRDGRKQRCPARAAGGGDNQFQQWMAEQDGASRLSERYGAGVPYWRLRSDFAEDKRERLKRRKARNAVGAESITEKYLAYFSEADPRKRATLLRDYTSQPADDRGDAAGAEDDGKAKGRSRRRRSFRAQLGGAAGHERGEKRQADSAGASAFARIRPHAAQAERGPRTVAELRRRHHRPPKTAREQALDPAIG